MRLQLRERNPIEMTQHNLVLQHIDEAILNLRKYKRDIPPNASDLYYETLSHIRGLRDVVADSLIKNR